MPIKRSALCAALMPRFHPQTLCALALVALASIASPEHAVSQDETTEGDGRLGPYTFCAPTIGFAAPEARGALAAANRISREALVSRLYRQAARAGKPLLVWILPADPARQLARGTQLVELLNYGDVSTMSTLALAEVTCATVSELRTLVPEARISGEPLMVLVETETLPAITRMLDTRLEGSAFPPAYERTPLVNARIRAIGELLRSALAAGPTMLASRERFARARLDARTIAATERAVAAGSITPRAADRAAAIVLRAALTSRGERRQRLEAALAQAPRSRPGVLPGYP